jgi:hypothetical protein
MSIAAVTQNSQNLQNVYAASLQKTESKSRPDLTGTPNNTLRSNTPQKPAVDSVTISSQAMQLTAQSKKA